MLGVDVLMEERSADGLPKLFVLGDSISMHYGPFLAAQLEGFFRYERKTAPADETVDLDTGRGANAGDSSMVLAYLRKRFAEPAFRPDILLLNCGLHDIKTDPATGVRQISPVDYRSNLMRVIELLSANGVHAVWVRTTHCADEIHNVVSSTFHRYLADVDTYNLIADDVMAGAGIPTIDLYRFTRNLGRDSDLFRDHVHFQPAICAQQAAFVAGALTAMPGLPVTHFQK